MQEPRTDYNHIREHSKKGLRALFSRTLFVHLLQAISVLLLSRWLTPAHYGLYGIINSWVVFSWYFCDFGLVGALTNQLEAPTERQLRAITFVQLVLSLSFSILYWFGAPWIVSYQNLPAEATIMIRILGLCIPLYNLRNIPRLLLDRNLRFNEIARIDVIESSAMYLMQMTGAYLSWGTWSFVTANVLRAFLGFFLLAFRARKIHWPLISWNEIKPLLAFGLPFQANAILPGLSALLIPLVLGSLLSVEKVGLITWTMGLAAIPQVLATNFNQVLFPSLSRIKNSPQEFNRLAQRGMQLSLLGFGWLFGWAATIASTGVSLIFSSRWNDSRPLFPVAIGAIALFTSRYLAAAILNALGKPGARFKIEAIAIILQFGITFVFVDYWDEIGFFYAAILVNFVALILTFLTISDTLNGTTYRRFIAVAIGSLGSYGIIHPLLQIQNIVAQSLLFFFFNQLLMALLDSSTLKDLRLIANHLLTSDPRAENWQR